MDFGLDKFVCWQTAVFSIMIWVLTLGVRRVVEQAAPQLADSKNKLSGWWSNVAVPFMPITFGAILAMLIAKTFPYPEGLQLFWGRVMFGVFCGMISGKIYQVVWGMMKSKLPPEPEPSK